MKKISPVLKRYKEDKVGTNIIITRTPLGKNIVKSLNNVNLEEGYLSEIEESQHAYGKPFLGLSMANANLFKDEFVANHLLSNEKVKFDIRKFSFKEKMKMIFLKKIFRKKQFRLVKIFYILIEFKLVLKLIVKKILGRKI